MSDCECSFVPPVEAWSFTGRIENQVDCDVNGHTDMKHWVVVKNNRGYALEIYVSAKISDPRLVRFSDCPDFALPAKNHVRDDFWEGSVVLDDKDDYTFGVFLFSDAQSGKKQRIDIHVITNSSEESVDQRYADHITVTA